MPDRSRLRTTWDGLFISEEPPHGATVLVFRRVGGATQYLVLRRAAANGCDDREWAWGPPAGARLPGEAVEKCAARELEEETGMRLRLHEVSFDPAWASYWAEAPATVDIRLSNEHDSFAWVDLDEAVRRCTPSIVAEQFLVLAGAAAA
jgi:8-oxo-dGTP pyrophosphatase MutT (NUDIX family)